MLSNRRQSGRLALSAIAAVALAMPSVAFAQTGDDDVDRAVRETADYFVGIPAALVRDEIGGGSAAAREQLSAVKAQVLSGQPVIGPILSEYSRGEFEPPVAIDLNPDPNIVEVVLVATPAIWAFAPGIETVVWSYNGTVPGPTIEAKKGDRVIVHFANLLLGDAEEQSTTVHWHGVELPADMDGSHVSQVSIPPRGGEFLYEFTVDRPALYWYHPHLRSNEQVEHGLYGALLVSDPEEDARLGLPGDGTILMLDDIWLDATGQIAQPFPDDPATKAQVKHNGRDATNHCSPGQCLRLVNGRGVPQSLTLEDDDFGPARDLDVIAGAPTRWRLVNVANSNFSRLGLAEQGFWWIGNDAGLFEEPLFRGDLRLIDHPEGDVTHPKVSDPDPDLGVLLTPGERADIVFVPSRGTGETSRCYSAGANEVLACSHDWGRGHHQFTVTGGAVKPAHVHTSVGPGTPKPLVRLNFVGEDGPGDWVPPSTLRPLEAIPYDSSTRVLHVKYGHTAPDPNGDMIFWVFEREDGTKLPGSDPGIPLPDGFEILTPADVPKVTVGETAIWEVRGAPHADHNFHTHGFMFQPIEYEYHDAGTGETWTQPYGCAKRGQTDCFRLVEKDTIIVPKAPARAAGSYTKLRAVAHFSDEGREGEVAGFGGHHGPMHMGHPGGWMVHCHILEHSDLGMMGFFEVRYPE